MTVGAGGYDEGPGVAGVWIPAFAGMTIWLRGLIMMLAAAEP